MRWLTVISTPSSARMSAAYDEASSAVDIFADCCLVCSRRNCLVEDVVVAMLWVLSGVGCWSCARGNIITVTFNWQSEIFGGRKVGLAQKEN